jgi:glycerol-3-phosphate acyltransferase PlsY
MGEKAGVDDQILGLQEDATTVAAHYLLGRLSMVHAYARKIDPERDALDDAGLQALDRVLGLTAELFTVVHDLARGMPIELAVALEQEFGQRKVDR